MKDKICVFTSTHLENDIRIFKKQIKCLLDNGLEVFYYTNKENLNIRNKYIQNHDSFSDPNLKIRYNKSFNEIRRFSRLIKSFFIILYLPKDCRIYHFHDPDLLFTGLLLKIIGKKVIYDVHENYRDSILDKEYLPRFLRRIISGLVSSFETFCCRFYDAIICATPYIEKRFRDSGIIKTIVINNYPFKYEFSSFKNSDTFKENRIIYAGGITNKRGIFQLIQSLTLIDKEMSFKLILAGEIYPISFETRLKSLEGWKNVEYMGILSRSALAKELSKAIAGIVIFLPEKNHIYAQPNKIFEYMSASIPVICSDFPLWRKIVEANNCGICVDPENVNEIASGIQYILSHEEQAEKMGKNGKEAVEKEYNWEAEESKFIMLYKDLLSRNY
jgi:glycosyltransferase involved in cell wall biosynthesis